MALYAIGDLHLSLGVSKPMDVFPGWDNYVERLTANWNRVVGPEDTVIIMGDVSWGINFEEAEPDFRFIDRELNGSKIVMKGNHDYWWNTMAKMQSFLAAHDFSSIRLLFNNAYKVDGRWLCGTRGWTMDGSDPDELKIILREAGRLERSLAAAGEGERIAFLHYPPILQNGKSTAIIEVMKKYGVRRCYYGHLHGSAIAWAVNREVDGIDYRLLSADALGFCPYKIEVKCDNE